MSEAGHVYFISPWLAPLALCAAVSLGFVIIAWQRGRELLQGGALVRFVLLFIVCNGAAIATGWYVSRLPPADQPHLIVHRDYLACGSWTNDLQLMHVPWHAFSAITVRGSERRFRFLDVELQLDLDPRYLREVPWHDFVQWRRHANCQISWLSDNPWRLSFADTSKIFAEVEAAWRAARER